MCGFLRDAVLDDQGSARELEKIERSNLFLVPLDQNASGTAITTSFVTCSNESLRRVSRTCFARCIRVLPTGSSSTAIPSPHQYLSAAGDLDRLAAIITEIALPSYYGGRITSVEKWLSPFDDVSLLERYPAVVLLRAASSMRQRTVADAGRWLEVLRGERSEGTLPDGCTSLRPWIAVLRAALCRDGVHQMLADAETGLAGLPKASLMRPAALLLLGSAHMLLGENELGDALLGAAQLSKPSYSATDTEMVAERASAASVSLRRATIHLRLRRWRCGALD